MFTPEELKNYHTGFELLDPLGKGRMRELIYDYRLQQLRDKSEIERLQSQFMEQAKSIDMLVKMKIEPVDQYKDKIAKLESDLKYANLTIDSLTRWAEHLEQLLKDNGVHLVSNTWTGEESA